MTTNKIQANQNIFTKLSDFSREFSNRDTHYNISLRFFIKTNEEEKEWLEKMKIKNRKYISNKVKFALLEYNGKLYYVTVGIDMTERNDEVFQKLNQYGLKETEINAGIFTNLIFSLDISIANQIDPLNIINTIFIDEQPIPDKNYSYDLKDIQPFFDLKMGCAYPAACCDWDKQPQKQKPALQFCNGTQKG
jgi:ferritin-like protein